MSIWLLFYFFFQEEKQSYSNCGLQLSEPNAVGVREDEEGKLWSLENESVQRDFHHGVEQKEINVVN